MAGPSITLSVTDPGALAAPVDTSQIPIRVGVCASGELNQCYTFGNEAAAIAALTRGHLLDCVLDAFAAGERSVKAIRLAVVTAGDVDDEVDAGSTLVVTTVTGSPLHFARVRIVVEPGSTGLVSGGEVSVRYSLDAWDVPFVDPTYSAPVVLPANGQLVLTALGLTVTIDPATSPASGAYVVINVTAGHYDATGIAGLDDALESPLAGSFSYVVYTGDPATAAAGNTQAVAVNALASGLYARKVFFASLAGAGMGTDADTITATAGTVAVNPPFTSLGYEGAPVANPRAEVGRGRILLREHEIAARRISQIAISTDPGRVASGGLTNVLAPFYDAKVEGDALHDARIASLRTWSPHALGTYIQRQRLLTGPVSNFKSWQHAAVMIQALRAINRVMVLNVLENVRQLGNGTLDARDRADIRQACLDEIDRTLTTPLNVKGQPGHISARDVIVSDTTLLPAVSIRLGIRPMQYAETLTAELSYSNQV